MKNSGFQHIQLKMVVMEEVADLSDGKDFGEQSLIDDKPRNATIFVKSEKLVAAILTKDDYLMVLGESEKRKIDEKVRLIQQFDMFKAISRHKLKNIYRFFFSKGQNQGEPYRAQRGQYLYRQGDGINGIFCILTGQV